MSISKLKDSLAGLINFKIDEVIIIASTRYRQARRLPPKELRITKSRVTIEISLQLYIYICSRDIMLDPNRTSDKFPYLTIHVCTLPCEKK